MLNLKGAYSQCDCGSGCGKCIGASGQSVNRTMPVDNLDTEDLSDLENRARSFAKDNQSKFEAALQLLVEIPTITPGGGHEQDCRKLASHAVEMFKDLGLEAAVVETDGLPCIVARAKPKVDSATMNIVIYNHMDVVPADKSDGWARDPFTFVREEDTQEGYLYYGRGTTDDKGPALTALYGALLAQQQEMPIDVSFIWELEEEIGSPNFEVGLQRMRSHLPKRIDLCICSDTIWISDALPTVVETVRGSISFDVSLETADGDVHSGICGGVARNPLNELVKLASDIAAPSGLPNLQCLQASPVKGGANLLEDVYGSVTSESFRQDFGLRSLRTDDPELILQRSWAEPCVEIVGLSGGWQGKGVKAAIPPQASLKFNVRLVVGQTPDEVERGLRKFITEQIPDAQVSVFGKMNPFDGRLSEEQRQSLRRAYTVGFKTQPAFGCVGGSIGVLGTLSSALGVQVLLPSLSSPSQGYHGKNENYSWKRFENGLVMYAVLFNELLQHHTN